MPEIPKRVEFNSEDYCSEHEELGRRIYELSSLMLGSDVSYDVFTEFGELLEAQNSCSECKAKMDAELERYHPGIHERNEELIDGLVEIACRERRVRVAETYEDKVGGPIYNIKEE